MAKSTDTAATTFHPVDVDTMPKALADKYKKLKAAQEAEKALKKEFEAAFTEVFAKKTEMPSTKRLVFGYRFGQLAFGVVDATEAKAKATKNTFSFS